METKQAADLDNIVIGPGGRYIRSRKSSAKQNATELGTVSDGYPVIGIGYLNPSGSTNEYILAIKKGKAYSSNNVFGGLSFTDRTGAVTISNGGSSTTEQQIYRWSFCVHNNLLIGFGGNLRAPDAPFKWAGGAVNVAALGGSPPSAAFGFSANNRVFGCRTAANQAIFQWSVLGNPEDWTGTGSGSTTIGGLDDGSPVTGVAVLPQNIAIVFKSQNTYQVSLVSSPFPQYLLFESTGALPGSVVTVDGKVYFITIKNVPMVTDGDRLERLPPFADDLFSTLFSYVFTGDNYYPVYGFRKKGADCDWVCWSAWNPLTGSAFTVAWDLINKCWLKFSTGMNFTSAVTTKENYLYGGYYNQGFIFSPDYISATPDDTGENSGNINAYWRSGWMTQSSAEQASQIQRLVVEKSNGATSYISPLTVNYGFNYTADQKSTSVASVVSTPIVESISTVPITGNGNGFQFKIGQNISTTGFRISKVWIGGKASGQKQLAA